MRRTQKSRAPVRSPADTIYCCIYLNRLSRSALVTTKTEDIDIAKAANIGERDGPPKRVSKPMATGIPNEL